MDVRQLRDFVAVVRHTSFAAASRSLRVSQPGLGYQIKQLEDELQVKLLQRHARGVSLTSAGETFLNHAESILAAVNDAHSAMAVIACDHRQEVRIGLSPSPGQILGPLLLASHSKNLKLRFREGYSAQLHEGISQGTLDVAICLAPARPPLLSVQLYSEPLYLIGPKGSSAHNVGDIGLSELAALPLVLGARGHVPRRILEETASRRGIKLLVEQELEAAALRRSLVLQNGCHTVCAYGHFAEEIERGGLFARRIADPDIRQSVHMVYSANLPSRVEKALTAQLRAVLASSPHIFAPDDCPRLAAQ